MFEKGHPKIPGSGRPFGKSKKTSMREFFTNFAVDRFDEFVAAWEEIDNPKDKCEIYLKATKHVIPTVSSIQFEDEKVSTTIADLIAQRAKYKK